MANISKIEGYDLKDATARSDISTKMDKTNPSGNGSLSLNRKSGTTVGYMSTTEGTDGTATGNYSHAGGYQGVATSFASYAEGQSCEASGYTSHAQGLGTKANHRSQFAFGEYNVADASTAEATAKGNYIEIVGKGTSDANRSNARTLDWNGNEVLAGDLVIKGNISVNAAIEKTTGVVTMETGYSSTTNSVVKIGKLVLLSLVFSASTDISSRVTVGKLPEGFRPVATIGVSAPASTQVNYYANRLTNTLIASNGDIIVGDLVLPNGTVKEVRITTTFITS